MAFIGVAFVKIEEERPFNGSHSIGGRYDLCREGGLVVGICP